MHADYGENLKPSDYILRSVSSIQEEEENCDFVGPRCAVCEFEIRLYSEICEKIFFIVFFVFTKSTDFLQNFSRIKR